MKLNPHAVLPDNDIKIHVFNACRQVKLFERQYTPVYRYYLHRAGMTPKQIAELTNASHIKVYDSIKRVREGKRFDQVKARLNKIL
jgi:predicted DNA-binding protein YlxM (UPF0122 family)